MKRPVLNHDDHDAYVVGYAETAEEAARVLRESAAKYDPDAPPVAAECMRVVNGPRSFDEDLHEPGEGERLTRDGAWAFREPD